MTLQSLNRLGAIQLRFLFCVTAGFLERRLDAEDLSQARFWTQVAQAVERERDGETAEPLNFDDLLDADVELAAKVCADLADARFPSTAEFFQDLAAVVESELRRRRLEVANLDRLL